MLASGLPEKSSLHAKNIALVALDMLDIVREIAVDNQPIRVNITWFNSLTRLGLFCNYNARTKFTNIKSKLIPELGKYGIALIIILCRSILYQKVFQKKPMVVTSAIMNFQV